MDERIVEFSIVTFLRQLRERVEEAHGIAEAADACARVGRIARGVEIANDVDELIHDAEQLLGMAAHLIRSAATGETAEAASAAEAEPPETPITETLATETIRVFLAQARERLHRTVGVAKAAEILAAAGKPQEAARFALDVEPLLYEARHFINTASLVNRLSANPGATGLS